MLPGNEHRMPSRAIGDGAGTGLGKAFKSQLERHPAESGIHLLSNGLDAFVGRAVSARLAERSIDVQYYMFRQGTVGRLLIRELVAAADRGVRVRMLIDDMYGAEADEVWLALDAHRNVEVRLFNPFVRGRSKNLQFVTRLKTVNHRMHSKSFTVDNQISIVGGRNIGDEYFAADPNLAFADMDVILGPTCPLTAWPIGECTVRVGAQDESVLAASWRLTYPWNLAGLPAISLPCGFDRAGLPIGLQLASRPFDEMTLIRAADAYERGHDWKDMYPKV